MTGAFLSLRRVLPDRYPLDHDVDAYLADENSLGRMLDYGDQLGQPQFHVTVARVRHGTRSSVLRRSSVSGLRGTLWSRARAA
jgi:hypothetical protein